MTVSPLSRTPSVAPNEQEVTRPSRVVILELGRRGALGAARRVESWSRLWRASGAEVITLLLLEESPVRPLDLPAAIVRCARRSDIALETLSWSRTTVTRRLRALAPDVVLATTARSWLPGVAPIGSLQILDYVDVLSESYLRRAGAEPSLLRRGALELLAGRMRGVESQTPAHVVRTAAGRQDARSLNAEWVPNVVDVPPLTTTSPDVDLLFVGTLSYSPNIDALQRMSRVWPAVRRRRPTASFLVAGANPTSQVRSLVAQNGWELAADFPSLHEICARARVAVSPVRLSTGIQNKVLETAAHALPQIIDPSVAGGLGPGFPALVPTTDAALVDAIVSLLDDPTCAVELGSRARAFVESQYTVSHWTPWCLKLLRGQHPSDQGQKGSLLGVNPLPSPHG